MRTHIEDVDVPKILAIVKEVLTPAHPRLQGLAGAEHANYWQRFDALPDIPRAQGDQSVLEALKKGDVPRLLDLIQKEETGRAVLYFDNDRFVRALQGEGPPPALGTVFPVERLTLPGTGNPLWFG